MDWRQFSFKPVVIWRMLRYKSGDQLITPNHFNFPFLTVCKILFAQKFETKLVTNRRPNEGHSGGELALKRKLFRRRLCPQMKAILAANWHPNEGYFGGDFVLKWRLFWPLILHPNEGYFGGELALKRRLFRWRLCPQMKAVLAANLHPNEGYFGGDFALKWRPFRRRIGTQTKSISSRQLTAQRPFRPQFDLVEIYFEVWMWFSALLASGNRQFGCEFGRESKTSWP